MNEDLIPRSAVKKALKAAKEKGNVFCSIDPDKETRPHAFVILRKALDAVDAIPAVEAESMEVGYWIEHIDPVSMGGDFLGVYYECSECGFYSGDKTKCCRGCGVKMEE